MKNKKQKNKEKKMPLNIKLIDNWKMRSDSHQYMLIRVDENGREFVEGYYSDIESCVQSLISKKIRGFESTSIELLMKEIKSLQAGLSKALHPLKLVVVPISEINKLRETQKSKI